MARQGKKGPRKSADGSKPVNVTVNMPKARPAPMRKAAPKKKTNGGSSGKADLRGIVQGVGSVPNRPWGAKTSYWSPSVFSALSYNHLPLPRAVGGYLVNRTTHRFSSGQVALLFGVFRGLDDTGKLSWTTNVCVNSNGAAAGVISGIGNTAFQRLVLTGTAQTTLLNALVAPAAVTVQIINPNAVQTTTGVVAASRAHQVLDWAGVTDTWTEKIEQLQTYTSPRLLAAAKLAFRGVKVDAIPYNMNAISDFRPFNQGPQGQTTWERSSTTPDLDGFAPIWVYNPEQVNLQYIVTVEWRVRFDPENPAHAAHTQYPVATDRCWQWHIDKMTKEGHGVKDISDTQTGNPA